MKERSQDQVFTKSTTPCHHFFLRFISFCTGEGFAKDLDPENRGNRGPSTAVPRPILQEAPLHRSHGQPPARGSFGERDDGSELRVAGWGLRVQGAGRRVQGSGCTSGGGIPAGGHGRPAGSRGSVRFRRFGVQGSRARDLGLRLRFRVEGAGCRVQGEGFRV